MGLSQSLETNGSKSTIERLNELVLNWASLSVLKSASVEDLKKILESLVEQFNILNPNTIVQNYSRLSKSLLLTPITTELGELDGTSGTFETSSDTTLSDRYVHKTRS